MPDFELHPRLAGGSHFLGTVDGCSILLKDNACFPWVLIVPHVPEGVEDLHQLSPERYEVVMRLLRRVSLFVSGYFQPDKLNVACIGNQVRQMHLHVVGRSAGDPAWPGTVWASDAKQSWEPARVEAIRAAARETLGLS
jgi:diadenosine tetraphosphate (Ap4A) HIT family hydrolase